MQNPDVEYFRDLEQGSIEWLEKRLGMLTASTMTSVLTPTLKVSASQASNMFLYELAADRITKRVTPGFVGFDMERGKVEEVEARIVYDRHFAPTQTCGFVVNRSLGFPIGYSPDALVGDDGMFETKSRAAKFQVQTVIEHMAAEGDHPLIPPEFMVQVQTGLFVTGRKWCDFLSYSNGLNMIAIRVEPIAEYQEAIAKAATIAEAKVAAMVETFDAACTAPGARVVPVRFIDHTEAGEIQT